VGIGAIPWVSAPGVAIIMITIFIIPCTLILAETAIKKVDELESMDGE
jgi:hypothetical protein